MIEGYLSIRCIPAMLPTTMVGPDRTRVSIHRHDTTRYDTVRYDTIRHDTTLRDSRLQAAWLKPIVEDCLKIACLCRLSVAVVCRYINTRERKGKEGKDSVFRHSFRASIGLELEIPDRIVEKAESRTTRYPFVSSISAIASKRSITALLCPVYSQNFFRPVLDRNFIVSTVRIIVARTQIDSTFSSFSYARLAEIFERSLPNVSRKYVGKNIRVARIASSRVSIFSIEMKGRRRTIAFEFQRENRHAVSSRYRRA